MTASGRRSLIQSVTISDCCTNSDCDAPSHEGRQPEVQPCDPLCDQILNGISEFNRIDLSLFAKAKDSPMKMSKTGALKLSLKGERLTGNSCGRTQKNIIILLYLGIFLQTFCTHFKISTMHVFVSQTCVFFW